MTLPSVFRDNPLASLTALNQQLIAQVDEETIAEEAVENSIIETGLAPGEYLDPDSEEAEQRRGEVRGRFATEDPLEFNRVKEWLELNVFGGASTGMSPLIGAFVNDWADELSGEPTRDEDGRIIDAKFPTLESLLNQDGFLNGALWLPLTATGEIPPVFESSQMDAEGVEVPVIGVSDPLTGVEFVETIEQLKQKRPQSIFEVARRARNFARGVFEREEGRIEDGGREGSTITTVGRTPSEGGGSTPERETITRTTRRPGEPLNLPDYMKSLIAYSDPAAEGREPVEPLPNISQDQLISALTAKLDGGGGRGSGGGGARRDIVFDKNHLIAQASDLWRRWMLDPNDPPADEIGGIIDRYVREARSFWSGKGGQLDFDTYVKAKFRAHPRWKQVYENKSGNQTEEEFLQSFMQPIAQFGQSAEFTRAQTEAAVRSGGSPQSQAQRVSRTREVEMSGGYSRRLARTLAEIGVGT